MQNEPVVEMPAIVEATIRFVQKQLATAEGGHDWFHTERVWKTALHIAQHESCDKLVVQLASLLHDIADSKFHAGNEELGPDLAGRFLTSQQQPSPMIEHVQQIIRYMSFKGGNDTVPFDSLEMRIVQDADRLDAIGAVGIARAFSYGGFKHRPLYDPAIPPQMNMTREQYKQSTAPTINHFYEKLLLLKDRMHTPTARELAEQRHQFMLRFLEQFYFEARVDHASGSKPKE